MRTLLNKVPEVTLYFWIIKILCTTVGETAADFLNAQLGLGLNGTSLVMGILLIIVLIVQFRASRYLPSAYWLTVVLISVVGTLSTDTLTDTFGVSLAVATGVFALCLAATFGVWYAYEKTLSIHTIVTLRREAFYWATILFTFALGTAAGDLVAEQFGLGYLTSFMIFLVFIAFIYSAYRMKLNGVTAFWIAYILTRPLGASLGDYLSQAPNDGGLGLGTTITSLVFLTTILVLVLYLSATKKDLIEAVPDIS